jgi:hypothetical protein
MVIYGREESRRPGYSVMHLKPAPKYDVIFGAAGCAKTGKEISGDTHSLTRISDERFLLALCDGMGSGEAAEKTSSMAISMVENFYRAGFDSETILSGVNRLLNVGGEDNFAALDICAVDLCKGVCDFIKLGAPEGYLKNKKNSGTGFSVTKAVHEAKNIGADIVVTMAGDDQMDPAYLPNLLDPIIEGGYDSSKGNRFFSKEGLKGMPKHRVWGSIILTFMTRLASGFYNIFDAQNGYYALGPKALQGIDFDSLTHGFPYENDLWINLNILGLKIIDVPIPARYGDEVSYEDVENYSFIYAVSYTGFF